DLADKISDVVNDTKDVFDDKVAEDFVNDHCSDNDATNPYDKANDPVDKDNAGQVISGESEYNGYPQSIKDKINDLIAAKSEDSDEPYSGYPEMLKAAKDALGSELTLPEVVEIMTDNGFIRVDIQVENLIDPDNENADNIDEIIRILGKSVDQEDVDVFNAGGYVEITMVIREVPDNTYNDAVIKADGNVLVKHIEVIIQKTLVAADGTLVADKSITKTAEPITFVVPLGDAEKEGRVFYVYVDHGGRAPAEKNPDGDGILVTSTVSFTNDTFSVFSIAYAPEKEEVAYTYDSSPIMSSLMMMFSSFAAIAFVGRKRREEESELY
ncbi:MAG: hypothetical protein IK046_02705, partial [Clostridia bacterium]|nr:hypothetical protein [Clostridia bacterium]